VPQVFFGTVDLKLRQDAFRHDPSLAVLLRSLEKVPQKFSQMDPNGGLMVMNPMGRISKTGITNQNKSK